MRGIVKLAPALSGRRALLGWKPRLIGTSTAAAWVMIVMVAQVAAQVEPRAVPPAGTAGAPAPQPPGSVRMVGGGLDDPGSSRLLLNKRATPIPDRRIAASAS